MKKIKGIAGLAFGAFFTALAAPLTTMAATEQKRSLGETMGYALLNTVMGIVIVFLVLLLISKIIGLFKYIYKFEQGKATKKVETEAPAPVEEEEPQEELSDDLELVAVITAAIHAYEEAQGNEIPVEGLVVRSIRKAGKAKWQNA